jgi:hypothetical protein
MEDQDRSPSEDIREVMGKEVQLANVDASVSHANRRVIITAALLGRQDNRF